MFNRPKLSLLRERKAVLVIPAFEMEDFSRGMPDTKEELMEYVEMNMIRQVRILLFPRHSILLLNSIHT
jgi:hypothetical protein